MKKQSKEPRRVTYANEERARHYVENLIQRGPVSGPLYLIVSPKLRGNRKVWPMLLKNLREILPGVGFRVWPQIAEQAQSYDGTPVEFIRDNHAGAVLIGARHHHMLRVGPVALAEATGFAASGKPTFAFTGSRLAAWPDCQVFKIPPEARKNRFVTAYVLLPLRPPDMPLPTFAASCHMLGIREPGMIARAAGLGSEPPPQRPPRGSERPAAGSGAGRRPVPPVRFVTGASTRTEGR